jgi:hypothetical protein
MMYIAIVYDSANNKMVIFYEDQGNSYDTERLL